MNIKQRNYCSIFPTFLLYLLTSSVQANLLISPTHLTFDDRQRSAKIVLINNGDATRTYRIGWKELKAQPQGGYQPLSEIEQKSFNSASQMIRFSPKQVTLKAGERQIIKMALRRPKDLNNGEYRSHLALTALPVKSAQSEDTIKLNVLMSYTLPVIVRQGEKIATRVSIGAPELSYQPDAQIASIKVPFFRHGLYSTQGKIHAYWQAAGSDKTELVAQLNGYNLYHELEHANVILTWHNAVKEAGSLRIVYLGTEQFSGNILAEKTVPVTTNMFLLQNK